VTRLEEGVSPFRTGEAPFAPENKAINDREGSAGSSSGDRSDFEVTVNEDRFGVEGSAIRLGCVAVGGWAGVDGLLSWWIKRLSVIGGSSAFVSNWTMGDERVSRDG